MYAEEEWQAEAWENERVAILARIEARAVAYEARAAQRQAEETRRRWSRDHGTRQPDHQELAAGENALSAPW